MKNIFKNLGKFASAPRLTQIILVYIARQLNESDLLEVQEAFNAIDKDSSGVITQPELF